MQAEACLWFFRIFREKNKFFLFFKFCPTAVGQNLTQCTVSRHKALAGECLISK